MKRDLDALDELLRAWHLHEVRTPPETGWYVESPSCKQYRASRQYDAENGALDDDMRARMLREVGYVIERMADPWRAAIYAHARNLATGQAVWVSPRLPQDATARAVILGEARVRLGDALGV